jgi:release factor glutamine methyltransferase
VIEHITGTKRTERIIHKEKKLSKDQLTQLNDYLLRLKQHEPVQYVLNEAWFYGLKFYVDKNVLIPRPETEELIEWVITDCKFPIDKLSILDIGTGSGCIPISLKRKLRRAQVWSCDISEAALQVARNNAITIGADVNFLQLDFLNRAQTEQLPSFNIIISNPPYIPEKNKEQMQPNVLNYEPATALFVPDNDPLYFIKPLLILVKKNYTPVERSIWKFMKILEKLLASFFNLTVILPN